MTDDGDVPDKLGEGGHVQEERFVESGLRHSFLFHGPFSGLYRGDDRLGERLGVFLLHESLDVLTVKVGCRRVVLFVFVEDDGVMNGFCDCRREWGIQQLDEHLGL